jgi:hypothetical protein
MHNRYRRLDRQTFTSTKNLPPIVPSLPAIEFGSKTVRADSTVVETCKYPEIFERKSPFHGHLIE